eukprot:COSAG02_NODE_9461_length_2209_cov_1.006161_2_plen_345_part_00
MNATSAEELGDEFVDMWQEGWVDPQTRAVILDFTVYNPSRQLITVVKVLAEFTAMGKVLPMYSIRTLHYKPLWDIHDSRWWVDCSLLLMVCFYATAELYDMWRWFRKEALRRASELAEAAKELATITAGAAGAATGVDVLKNVEFAASTPRLKAIKRKSYFDDPWNALDLSNYALFVVSITFEIWSRFLIHEAIAVVNDNTARLGADNSEFVAFYTPAYLSSLAYTLLGVNAVITWLKTLKYLNNFPHLSMLTLTLRKAIYPTVSFLIMFFIIFVGCGQAFNMAFGPYMKSYSTFTSSMMSLFRALLGEFEYDEMQQTHAVIGPMLFLVFMLLVLFVLVNMFIA